MIEKYIIKLSLYWYLLKCSHWFDRSSLSNKQNKKNFWNNLHRVRSKPKYL